MDSEPCYTTIALLNSTKKHRTFVRRSTNIHNVYEARLGDDLEIPAFLRQGR